MEGKLFYAPGYNLCLFGLEAFHPFDARKYDRALRCLVGRVGAARVEARLIPVTEEVSDSDLLLAHGPRYLATLTSSPSLAAALEVPVLRWIPYRLLRRTIVRSMRLATQGTVMAVREALLDGLAINVSGGYHHASHNAASGFCLYGDVFIAIRKMREEGRLAPNARVLYVDLDAHQGNGFACLCLEHHDSSVYIYDQYNRDVFPNDARAARRINLPVPLRAGTADSEYLTHLHAKLPLAIKEAAPALAIYNAGSDIFEGDALGGLSITDQGIRARDAFVLETLTDAGIPTAVVLSGGYSDASHRHVADLLELAIA